MEFSELIRRVARRTLSIEEAALAGLQSSIDDDFVKGVKAIYDSQGRLIVTGIGKTAIVAKKIVATLNSTGTPAIFLHAADAIHGDIGMILPDDIVLCLSKSGETAEIRVLSSLVRQFGNPLIAMVGRGDCTLAKQADYTFLTPVDREADPNNLAPTTSTTVQMALGDAMATALLALRGFSSKDFAQFHPGGSLGKRLYLRVDDLAGHHECPRVSADATLREVIIEMTAKRLGATGVVSKDDDRLLGIITDGDLRRMLTNRTKVDHLKAADIMTAEPRTVLQGTLAVKALEAMRTNSISQLPVCGPTGRYIGMIHLHDLIREGLI
ncbi:D-arabinose 5-phosphate isomerase [Lewinellaceae bacterium SD302]|nr:D-arabinose 5-phosphate isomerase [Lewinellaceae bacterium SD302]